MDEIKAGKIKLQKALLEVSEDYLANLELAPEESVHFSPKFERKMAHLLKLRKKTYWKLINKPWKKTIAVCLAAAILVVGLLGFKPIREPIFEFFADVYEQFTEFFFGAADKQDASKMIEDVHTLTYVPEGYEIIEKTVFTGQDKELCTVWKNNDDKEIVFYQSVLTSKTTLDSEDSEKKILSNGLQIATIQKDGMIYTFWNNEQYAYTLLVQDVADDELEKIIESFV
ncbi:MAG: DUF4367 domain-containing protein [Clostridia bacterium]|nr:DUF4367 domain-containing protein [Clostridia bacterium]